jgi:hypothetical protein
LDLSGVGDWRWWRGRWGGDGRQEMKGDWVGMENAFFFLEWGVEVLDCLLLVMYMYRQIGKEFNMDVINKNFTKKL